MQCSLMEPRYTSWVALARAHLSDISAFPRWLRVTSVAATRTLANRTMCALQPLPAAPPLGCALMRIFVG